uniref:Beta-ketoacyl-[acyl-carrier-protein] synthase III N-terminal domain-containing protein n=2 Tax=Physcomitrium patens TaxID=3218 RepID=A0A7I4F040_PHYPA
MACATAPALHSSASWTASTVPSLRGGVSAHERVSLRYTQWRTSLSNVVGCRAVMSAENRDVSPTSSELKQNEGEPSSHVLAEQRRRVGRGSRLVGSGSAVPKHLITNEDLSKFVDTSDEWISVRTGIRNRRVLGEEESVTSLSVEASRKALEMANVKPEDVDLLLLCTSTPDDLFGSAPQVQKLLGCHNALAFDLTAACSGFVLGLVTATRFIRGGGYENVLVVGSDALSRYVDWTDRGTCILFGDASGALLLQAATDDQDSLLGFDLRSDGNGHKHLHVTVDSVAESSSSGAETNGAAFLQPGKASYECLQMNGKEVFKFAVRAVPQVVEGALQEAGITGNDVDWLLLHQANQRILDSVSDRLHIPSEKVISNLANYGLAARTRLQLDTRTWLNRDKQEFPGLKLWHQKTIKDGTFQLRTASV